jgi:micrococcal nuclease
MNRYYYIIITVAICFLYSCKSEYFEPIDTTDVDEKVVVDDIKTPINESEWYRVIKFVDGDTFWIDNGTPEGLKIRFIGVDTPEKRPMFGRPAESYGKTAAAYVKDKIGTDGKVRLELDVDYYDRYNRTLAYIYLEDGTFLNEDLISKGLAQVMTVVPNVKYVELFTTTQIKARENKLGIWSGVDKP